MRPTVRPFGPGDRAWAEGLLVESMGSTRAVRLGELVEVLALPGLVAERPGERLGLLTYIDNLHALGFYQRRDLLELELRLG